MYIMIEGGEGAGKTTVTKVLSEYLTTQGHDVLCVREIGGCPVAEELRKIIYTYKTEPMSQFLIFLTARIELFVSKVKPHLDKGGTVISDRGLWSSLVYQGYCQGIDIDYLYEMNKRFVKIPDISFFLMVNPEIGLAREKIQNPFGDLEFHNKVYAGYEHISEIDSSIRKIYTDYMSIQDIFEEIKKHL